MSSLNYSSPSATPRNPFLHWCLLISFFTRYALCSMRYASFSMLSPSRSKLLLVFLLVPFTLYLAPVSIAHSAQVTLDWEGNSKSADGYRLFSRLESQSFNYSQPTWEGEDSSCTVTTEDDNSIYYFVVRAYNASGESENSNEVSYQPTLPPRLSSLSINGADAVEENTVFSYSATATFQDGSTETVTESCSWSVDSPYASIENNGALTTSEVPSDQIVTITASYTFGNVTKAATKMVTILDVPPVLLGLSISGADTVEENTTASYTAIASFYDGSTETVTESCTWSVNSSHANIASNGLLAVSDVSVGGAITITASYAFGGVTQTETKQVMIIDVAPVLTALSISGAGTVDEHSTSSYTAMATFDDGRTLTVTESCSWSVDSPYASIDNNGVLTTSEVMSDQAVTIIASYALGDITQTANKVVTITDISESILPPHKPVINSPYYGQVEYDLPGHITTEPFSDSDEGDFHSQSHWQISHQEDFTSTVTVVFGDVPEADYASKCQDTWINTNATNYSTEPSLYTYTWPANTVANRTIIKWDLSAIPQNAIIQDATLSLYMHGYEGTGGDDNYEISAHKIVNHDPIISSCSWNTFDGVNSWTGGSNGGAQDLALAESTTVVDKALGYRDWNITQMVQEWVNEPSINFGLMLNSDSTAAKDSNRHFRSTNYSDPYQRPKLTITYTLSETSELVFDTVTNEYLTELIVPLGVLEPSSTYYVRVQFYDGSLEPSEWSDQVEFTTSSDEGPEGQLPQFEFGEVGIDNNWKWVGFNKTFVDPVVVAAPLSHDDEEPAVVRIRNVDSTGFEIHIQEWGYLDGLHAEETVSYLVMESGSYTLVDGTRVEAGLFETKKTWFNTVAFSQAFHDVPVVVTSITTLNETDAVTGRLRSIGTEAFEFRLQEQESNEKSHAIETVAYIAWEPSSGTLNGLTFEVNKTEDVITHQFQSISFSETFIDLPVFIADMQTNNGGNTGALRWQNKTLQGVDVQIDEEQSLDSETNHTTEAVGYMLFSQLPPLEFGEMNIDHNWKWVEFKRTFDTPIVVAKPLSQNDADPGVVRIRNVDNTGFEIRVQEWDYLDGLHVEETVSYLVIERGSYTLADGTQVEAGLIETKKTGFDTVVFNQTFQEIPVVISSVTSFNESDAVTSRFRNISRGGFEFRMQEQELNSQTHTSEIISYIAWEPSSGTLNGLTFEVNKTEDVINNQFQSISFSETFIDLPVFIADMQTNNGGNTANVRWQNKNLRGVDVRVDEEQSKDDETNHTSEVVGYMLFSRPE